MELLQTLKAREVPVEHLFFRAGQNIFQQGTWAHKLYFDLGGYAWLEEDNERGAVISYGVVPDHWVLGHESYYKEDLIKDGRLYGHRLRALTDCQVAAIRGADIMNLVGQKDNEIILGLTQEDSTLTSWLADVGKTRVLQSKQDTWRYLVNYCYELKQIGVWEATNGLHVVGDEELGSIVGISRKTVVKICSRLEKLGVIRRRGGERVITNHDLLRQIATEGFNAVEFKNKKRGGVNIALVS